MVGLLKFNNSAIHDGDVEEKEVGLSHDCAPITDVLFINTKVSNTNGLTPLLLETWRMGKFLAISPTGRSYGA
jgi:hypothetical protein